MYFKCIKICALNKFRIALAKKFMHTMRNGAVEEFIFIANEAYLRLQTFTEIT